MNILMSGASGLVGAHVASQLQQDGHHVVPLVRQAERAGVHWDPRTYELSDPAVLGQYEAVIHLAGEPIVGRWTEAKKERIRSSRVDSTAALANALAVAAPTLRTWIIASAIGYYGDRGEEPLTEDSELGTGFLAGVCRDWEAAAEPARAAGIRVVHLRFGMLLSPAGGALKTMLPPFRSACGGILGSGQQFMSWAALPDAVGAVSHVLNCDAIAGAVNVVSPRPVTNREFTKTLAHVLRRPAVFPIPACVARMAFGEMADALLLASQRVQPVQLEKAGYEFAYPDLASALQFLLT